MGVAHNVWMKTLNKLNKDLNLLSKAVNIDEQRSCFLSLSKSLSNISNKMGVEMPKGKTLYLEFCPMADNNRGDFC